ncbi:hypothetical protein FAUST_2118 [Fusarium austroamericanum]|uniref:Metallo-beta-lactamase domain-containing protein n=1 Tax=Fusarium austroamericanum TaxID=282268 RepID=A0AAN6C6Z3_FUSAU|nr:hypothetical protein FAUST_2118 [Fusarium austroamericanum]
MRTPWFSLTLLGLVATTSVHAQLVVGPTAQQVLDAALDALGGTGPISQLTGITFHAPRIYRSRSLMQSYQLMRADTSVMTSGSQNISYKFDVEDFQQRIDRHATPSNSWSWGSPDLKPVDFSLVVHGGADGFACYVNGNNMIHLPENATFGYTDAAFAHNLVTEARMLSPHLIYRMRNTTSVSVSNEEINGVYFRAVQDIQHGITVIMDSKSNMPYIVRTIESHPIYGNTTKDLYLSNYKEVEGIKFPHFIQTIYNSTTQRLSAVLEDFLIEEITLNPDFPAGYFDGIPENQSLGPKTSPAKSSIFANGLVTDYSSSMLGSGVAPQPLKVVRTENSVRGLSQVHWLVLNDRDDLGFKMVIIEFEKEVILCDSPPGWSDTIMKWVSDNLKKPITFVAPSHHHRDHSGGVPDFVKAGVKLIIPEIAVKYWSSVPGAEFVTFDETHPYMHNDDKIAAWFNWEDQPSHASDWTYVVVTERCASADSPVVAFEADSWEAGLDAELSSQSQMRQWLDQIVSDGLPRHTIVFPSHGKITPLEQLLEITAYPYPNFDVTNWRDGAAICGK